MSKSRDNNGRFRQARDLKPAVWYVQSIAQFGLTPSPWAAILFSTP